MATSQQGKKKKKVLSQQQIDKLLVMLKEEDKPLRAGILAKTLGYQSAKDINATLLRLEGYGMVTRIMMNNTPLWKFSGREASTPQLSAPAEEVSGETKDENISLAGSATTVVEPRPTVLENGNLTQGGEESLPSRPQSIKADLEWDPTDIQDVTSSGQQLAEYHPRPPPDATPYTNNTATFTPMSCSAITNTQMVIGDVTSAPSPAGTFSSVAETCGSLTLTNNREYSGQDLYVSVNQERMMGGTNLNMNNMGVKTTTMSNYANTDYYNQASTVNLGPMGNVLNMPPNYNIDFSQPPRSSGSTGSNSNDMYMLANTGTLSSAITGGSGSSNLQHTFPPSHSQTLRDFTGSSTYNPSMAPKTGSGAPSVGAFACDGSNQAHAVSHYSQTTYNTNSNSVARSSNVVPTYVVQEIMKPEGVGQYGLTGHQQEGRGMAGYQQVPPHHHHHHHHPHHHMDGSQVMSFSQQAYHHNGTAMNNTAAPSQLQHHHHHPQHHQQQQHRQQLASQHHHHHQPQQQPLAQAANFVNVGTFTGGNYNQFQGNFNNFNTSNQSYSGQHQGTAAYNSGNVNSKDFTSYAGAGAGFRNNQNTAIKRQHFSGYTPSGVFPAQMRPHMYNQIGQMRPPFPGTTGFTRPSKSNRGTAYNRDRSGQNPGGRGYRYQNGRVGGDLEAKGRQQSTSSSGKESPRSEVNKYMGTEVLDDICRRLAQQANTQPKHSDPQADGQCAGQKDKEKSPKMGDLSGGKLKQDVENQTEKGDKGKKTQDMAREHNPDTAGKLTNGRENGAISRHNGYRNYNGRQHQYQNRGGYYGRDNTRHNHYRNGPRHPDPSRQTGSRTLESGRYAKPSCEGPDLKSAVSATSSVNGKTGVIKEGKDAKHEVNKERPDTDQRSKDGEDTPLIRFSNLLTDHLDPNNVLLSHLFVKGLIGRVLVDQVRLMKTRRDAMERLMPVLVKMPKSAVMTGFSDALTKSGQGYLAELIKGTGVESEEMTPQHASLLELHRQNIAASMIPDKDLLVSLRTQSILTPDLHKFVSSQPSRAQQIGSLLHILPFRGDKAFEIFRTALRKSGQPWLAEQITMETS